MGSNARAGVRSAAPSKDPRHENDVQEASQNQAGGEEGRGRPAAKPEPSDAEREANGNYRHGHYMREAIQERRALRALIRQARKLAASVG